MANQNVSIGWSAIFYEPLLNIGKIIGMIACPFASTNLSPFTMTCCHLPISPVELFGLPFVEDDEQRQLSSHADRNKLIVIL